MFFKFKPPKPRSAVVAKADWRRENPSKFAKIQVNPTKSDQIKPLFYSDS